MAKKASNYASLLKDWRKKILKDDPNFANEIKELEELAVEVEGDAFSADKLKVPYVTAEPICESNWK